MTSPRAPAGFLLPVSAEAYSSALATCLPSDLPGGSDGCGDATGSIVVAMVALRYGRGV